jgi:serine/threonine protein kinase
VSELLEGQTLRARLAEGRLGPRKIVDYAAQIARGLAAHEKQIVHRDLKPENLSSRGTSESRSSTSAWRR